MSSDHDELSALPVYLVHWNQPAWVAASVDNLLASDVPVAITVVNNGPQSTSELVALLPDAVHVVSTESNGGYAGGANIGLERWLATDADLCVIGAHDLHIEPTGLGEMIELARTHPGHGILGPRLRGKEFGCNSTEAVGGSDEPVVDVAWVAGACMLLRRACIEDIGGYDRAYGSYSEDTDLCLRAARSGWKTGLAAQTTAWDLGSGDDTVRVTAFVNWVRMDWINGSRFQAIRRLARFAGQLVYHEVRSRLPGLPPDQRAASVELRGQFTGGFRRLPVLWARPDTQLSPHAPAEGSEPTGA